MQVELWVLAGWGPIFCQISCPAGEKVGGSVGTVMLLKVSTGGWGGRQGWFWLWYSFPWLVPV